MLAFLVAANLLAARAERVLAEERSANLLSGSAVPSGQGSPLPRYDVSVGEDTSRYLRFLPDAPLVIVSGMSQMYAINDRQAGDQTIAEWMDDSLAPSGIRAFGLAAPNLHNEEGLLLLLSAISVAPRKPIAFVYGLCFDKFRNVDLRPGFERLLSGSANLQRAWRTACQDFGDRYPTACRKMAESPRPAPAAGESSDALEARLRASAGNVLPLVRSRTELSASLQLRIFLFRNWLLRIKPTTKRPIIESRYRLNQEFLGLMADVARQQGVLLVLYVIPLNPQAENPYVPEQYQAFKAQVAAFARDRGLPFANLEGEVPIEAWGEFMGGPDFKHFRGEGHQRTARAILREFGPAIGDAARGARP